MILSFIDKNGDQLAEFDIFFEYNNQSEIRKTNTDGIIELTAFEEGSNIRCYISKKKKVSFEFIEEGELAITFERPTADMRFVVARQNGEAATDLKIHFKYGKKLTEVITDNTGQITLKKVPVKTKVKAYQVFMDNEENIEIFQCEKDKAQYFYVADKLYEKASMSFKLVDKNGQAIRNSDLRFKYEKNEFESVTDTEGRISIKDIKVNSVVECKQLMFGKSLPWHKFKFDKEVDEYIIHGEKLTPFGQENSNYDSQVRMKIKLVNSKNEPIANAIIKLSYDDKERNKYTNTDGLIQIDDILIGSKVSAFVDVRGNKTNAEFYCNEDNETQQMTLKTGNANLIFWIIPLFVIVGLAILYSQADLSSFKISKKEVETEIIPKDTIIIRNYSIEIKDKNLNKTLSNAKVELVYNDSIRTMISDEQGKVKFRTIAEQVPHEIRTSLLGYFNNTTKFNSDSNSVVFITKNDSINIDGNVLPCGFLTQSEGHTTTIKTFHLNMDTGRFKLFYNMFSLPDQIDIYNGSSHNISKESLIFSSNKLVTGLKNTYVTFDAPDSLITIQVKGNDAKTSWLYKVFCPKKTTIKTTMPVK